MANSPVPDQSSEFQNSGMTLITDPKSDKYLDKVRRNRQDPEDQIETPSNGRVPTA
jgi:hypothetical protein